MNPTVEVLWNRIAELETDPGFYPEGMCAFPFRLTGQGFFSCGDGLWRDEKELGAPSCGVLPVGGIVFLGNDFGTHASFKRLEAEKYEKPRTWLHLRARITRAKLPTARVFCTNSILGLRCGEGATALKKSHWQSEPSFLKTCDQFLSFQLRFLKPKLLVAMGPVAQQRVASLQQVSKPAEHLVLANKHRITVHCTTHPYGDFNGKNFPETRKSADAQALATAWRSVASVSENG